MSYDESLRSIQPILTIFLKGAYAYNFIPSEWSSFDKHEQIPIEGNINYIPMILFFTLAFFSNVGITPIPWILLSEVFPFKYVFMLSLQLEELFFTDKQGFISRILIARHTNM